jgi:hypothetical protein
MALSTGTRLGSYQILSAIGAGGMGEVYSAPGAAENRLHTHGKLQTERLRRGLGQAG